ncbi:unnamed protein product [Protopolystoma xenopodis]|uniref:Uncharacterized protein n=1 Tax=Protopolystoma xenopodis TaxID=117903 RepID=A0A448X6R4_9PLAT|nr:unnamed protein product [Protopolystoma xenopodis]
MQKVRFSWENVWMRAMAEAQSCEMSVSLSWQQQGGVSRLTCGQQLRASSHPPTPIQQGRNFNRTCELNRHDGFNAENGNHRRHAHRFWPKILCNIVAPCD